MRQDDDGDLQDGYTDAIWLHGHLNDLPDAAQWDVKDAIKLIREFSTVVRIIRQIDQNHVRNAYSSQIRARLP